MVCESDVVNFIKEHIPVYRKYSDEDILNSICDHVRYGTYDELRKDGKLVAIFLWTTASYDLASSHQARRGASLQSEKRRTSPNRIMVLEWLFSTLLWNNFWSYAKSTVKSLDVDTFGLPIAYSMTERNLIPCR